jgi:alcohol dehydrogenase class IV
MHFEFATANRIIFGAGALRQVPPLARDLGARAFVVVGTDATRAEPLLQALKAQKIEAAIFAVSGEPTIALVQEGAARARQAGCDVVIALGGGSVLDTGKAIAAIATNHGDVSDYLEVIGKGLPLTQTPLPCVAIPTTAGTGSEVTRNAVLASPQDRVKVSLRSPLMLPRLAVVDPELTYSLPPPVTASTGLDALTQLIEPFVSSKPSAIVDPLCRDGIRRAARSLRRAYEVGNDAGAREDMSLASLFGGLALANARLGAVHGFAGPIGGMFPAPHGAVCGRLLPYVMQVNVRALQQRASESEALSRFDEVGQLLTGDPKARAEDGAEWVERLCEALHVAPLSAYRITPRDFPLLVEKAAVASSMQGNPIKLSTDEMNEILARAL